MREITNKTRKLQKRKKEGFETLSSNQWCLTANIKKIAKS